MTTFALMTPGFENASFRLPDGEYRVGRDPGNAIVIRDQSISADHCEILIYGSEVIIRDRGSKNGTFVNGIRVQGQCAILDGQVVGLGRIEAKVLLSRDEGDGATAHTAMVALRDLKRSQEEAPVNLPIVVAPATDVASGESAQ